LFVITRGALYFLDSTLHYRSGGEGMRKVLTIGMAAFIFVGPATRTMAEDINAKAALVDKAAKWLHAGNQAFTAGEQTDDPNLKAEYTTQALAFGLAACTVADRVTEMNTNPKFLNTCVKTRAHVASMPLDQRNEVELRALRIEDDQ
jgi:hypothetical protein